MPLTPVCLKTVEESQENLQIMLLMNQHYPDYPTQGVLQMRDFLFAYGFLVIISVFVYYI